MADEALPASNSESIPASNSESIPASNIESESVVPAVSPKAYVISPTGEFGHIPTDQLHDAITNGGYTLAPPEQIDALNQQNALESQYGGAKGEVQAATEGALKGLLGPLAAPLETGYGITKEQLRGHEAANPKAAGLGELTGFVTGALTGTGEAEALTQAGRALEGATGLEKGGRLAQISSEAIKGAFETALYQGGEELHKAYLQDPSQTWETAITDIGGAAALGGLFGGATGALLRKAEPVAGTFVSELDRAPLAAGDFGASIRAADHIPEAKKNSILEALKVNKEKASAPEARAAAKALDVEIPNGALLESPLVQTNLDALYHSPYTFSGSRVRNNFDNFYNGVESQLKGAISSGEAGSKAELGAGLKDSITGQIREQYAPIKQAYEELAATHNIVPIEGDTVATLSKELRDIPEFRVSPSSPQGALVNQVFKDIKNVKTVSDLKILKDGLSLPVTASSQERRMVGILRDKLGDIEENAIEKYAKGFAKNDEAGAYIRGLLDQKKAVTPQYKDFIGKVSTLSEQLGKGRVHGVEDALRFLNERLTPEEVAQKLFAKKDSEFTKFFQKNFPDQFQQVKNYQRAEMIEKAERAGEFSPKTFFNNFNKLEPEIQKALYSPQEIKKIAASETLLREAFPKNFNPSGTAHVMAHRIAHETPKSLVLANVRDYAMEHAINIAARSAEGKQAMTLAKATIAGEKKTNGAIASIFNRAKEMPKNVIPMATSRAKLDKLVASYAANPTKMVAMNDNNTAVPEYSAASAASAARVVKYLSTLKPNVEPKNSLDSRRPANAFENAGYNRALDIAEQPLLVCKAIKDGRLTPFDLVSLKSMYPGLYTSMQTKLLTGVANSVHKGDSIPYAQRMCLSLFLGQPLDATMTPESLMSIQAVNTASAARSQQAQPQKAPSEASTKGLSKLPSMAQTPGQQREQSRATGKH